MKMAAKQNRRSEQDWVALIRECRASGLSDKDWCAHHAIQIRTFYKQVARLKKKALISPKHTEPPVMYRRMLSLC